MVTGVLSPDSSDFDIEFAMQVGKKRHCTPFVQGINGGGFALRAVSNPWPPHDLKAGYRPDACCSPSKSMRIK